MKPRYNLRLQPAQTLRPTKCRATPLSTSRVSKSRKQIRASNSIDANGRRQSLRLISTDVEPLPVDGNESPSDDDVLARHHRLMLEEQKDRRLYERYVRGQRTLRRLQCRRTHSAHLSDATRNRLLRELERERRYAMQDQICAHLCDHTLIFRHGCDLESKQPMDWLSLEEEMPRNKNIGPVHELDVMINNLKKVIRNSKSSISAPRLSVHERRNRRALLFKSISPTKSNTSLLTVVRSPTAPSNSISNAQSLPASCSPRLTIVRFTDNQNNASVNRLRTSNSQHLTCIQNVLSPSSPLLTPQVPSNVGTRKTILRSKSTQNSLPDPSPPKRRPLEKENCSTLTTTSSHSNTVLRATSPMVSIKHTASSSSTRSYPNTRKHPMSSSTLPTRRQTRLSHIDLVSV